MKKIVKSKNKLKTIIIIIVTIITLSITSGLFLLYGPYKGFRNWLITTAMTTMNHQYLATTFYKEETINKILTQNKIVEPASNTNLSEINTNIIPTTIYKDQYEKEILEHKEGELYKMIKIKGKNYDGFLTAIYDPSKVKVTTTRYIGTSGEYLVEMAKRENAIVAINGGGFIDDTTLNSGGEPAGIVIKNSQIISTSPYQRSGGLIGLTNDNKLYLGKITAQEAINIGIRDAVEFGPFLIVNGEASKVVGNGGYGLHPRTVIGQRKDGVILFLVIDGRRVDCIGADMDDLIEIMIRYGAYNAANLDGGNSSALIINNKLINRPINWGNEEATRPIATAFIVTN